MRFPNKYLTVFVLSFLALKLSSPAVAQVYSHYDRPRPWAIESGLDIGFSKFDKTYTRPSIYIGSDRKIWKYFSSGISLSYRVNGPKKLTEFGPAAYFRYFPIKWQGLYVQTKFGWAYYEIEWNNEIFAKDYKSSATNAFYGADAGWTWALGSSGIRLGASLGWEHHPRANFKKKLGGNTVYIDTHNTYSGAFLFRKEF